MRDLQRLEVPVTGMDCADCAHHVQHAIAGVPGVESVTVYLAAEKAVIRLDPETAQLPDIQQAVEAAGYALGRADALADAQSVHFARRIMTFFALVFGAVLLVVVAGEWLGLFDRLTARVPFWLGAVLVLASGWPILRNVLRAGLQRQITAHTLMTLGMLAALLIGEWATAAVVVFFMHIGDYTERFTAASSRRAVKDLTAMAPQTARVERSGAEVEVRIEEVAPGDTVVVRPGENIPVDGQVIGGQATVDQATITGESMPVEVAPGDQVFAATLARLGSIRVQTERVGAETTFGRVVKMVEEAEVHRAEVQRLADRFSAYYLPVVIVIAGLTFFLSRNPLSTAAVLLVACSCSFALATPIAVLASVGAAARRGLLIKGGKYLEALARADVLLLDKTGTLTLGKPKITDVISLNGMSESELLQMAASVERYSEHPLAEAVRGAAFGRGLQLMEPVNFQAIPGMGVRAQVNDAAVAVGNHRLIPAASTLSLVGPLEQQGKSLLFVACRDELVGVLAATDTLRPEVPAALDAVRALGLRRIELLTGDNARAASALSGALGVAFQANLLPEDKIDVVKQYQAQGHVVVMVGDGVNDAPALAQADVGIAMGAAGTDVALEAAHVAIMREDWMLVPQVLQIARHTMRIVKMNLGFTAAYNVIGLSLAAFGFLPPILAAAAQSLPDLGILANSARLLRQK